MEVVQYGDKKTFTIDCPRCKSSLTYKKSDTFKGINKNIKNLLGYEIKSDYVTCPVCKEEIEATYKEQNEI